MSKKAIVSIVLILVVIFIVMAFMSKGNKGPNNNISQNVIKSDSATTLNNQTPVKEFSMTSFTEMVGGEPKPQFSLKEITVNKGDRVRIKITEISGNHNFNIDEFGVYTETPLNKESVVEFVADKSGSFVYYCSKPGHRANGHWGTLKVI